MANVFKRFVKGLLLKGESSDPSDNLEGSIWQNSASNRLKSYIQGAVREVVTNSQSQSLTNKTIDADSNTLSNIDNADIKSGAAIDASKLADGSVSNAEFQYLDGVTSAIQTQLNGKQGNLVNSAGLASALSDETGSGLVVFNNSPNITTPTGIVKGDVGLGNVDNTSDATKNSASAVLTNKTIDGDDNTIQDLALSSLKTNLTDASKFIVRDASGIPVSNTKDVPSGAVVGTSDTQTLSAKTFSDAPLFKAGISVEDPGAGTNKININAPTLGADYTLTLPVDDGAADQVLKTDGSGTLSWTTALTDPMTTAGDIIYRNGSNVTARLPIGTDGQVLKLSSGLPAWGTDNSGGGSGGSSDPLQNLTNAELSNDPEYESDSEFIDDFEETQKASLTNMTQSNSAARYNTGSLTGNIKRDRAASTSKSSVTGLMTGNLQMIAPKATALSPSSTSTTVSFVFRGDVTSWFPNGKKVLIIRKFDSTDTNADGKTRHIAVLDSSNKPNVFSLHASAASVYNSGTDETTVQVLNPSAYDLDLDLTSTQFPDKLRLVPFNYVIKANSANETPSGGQYETMSINNVYGLDAVALQGEQFLSQITDASIDGRILKFDCEVSENRTYRVFRLVEDATGNLDIRFFGQVGSNTPIYLGTRSYNNGGGHNEEIGGDFNYFNRAQLAIADNGKGCIAYSYVNGSFTEARAVTFNLTDVTPVIADIVTNGSGSGIIYASGARNIHPMVAYDRTDLSFMMIFARSPTSNIVRMFAYTTGGTVYDSTSSNTSDTAMYVLTSGNQPPFDCLVTGTSTTHRTHFFYTDNTSFNVKGKYIDQGSTTLNNYNSGSDISSGGTTGNPAFVFAVIATATKGVVYYHSISTEYRQAYRYFDLTGTPSISSENLLNTPQSSGATVNFFHGYSSSAYATSHRLLRQIAMSNPSDGNHCLFGMDYIGPDSTGRSIIYEVKDITSYQGIHDSNYTFDGTSSLNANSGAQKRAQTFTTAASAKRVRTIAFRAYQNGTIASGNTLTCKIFATTASVPSGSALYTSTNTIDPSLLSKSTNGQWIYFNFDSVSLSNSTMYAAVLEVSHATDASNHVLFKQNSTSVFANGSRADFDGSTWSAVASDLVIEINGEYVKEISKDVALHSGPAFSNTIIHAEETSLGKISTTTFQALFRRMTLPTNTATERTRTGHPYRLVGTWATSANLQSTYTSAANAAYAAASFDPYCVFNVSYGGTDSKALNLNTGAEDDSQNSNDRSPFSHVVSAATGMASVTDASFQSGKCLNFNGSSDFKAYTDSAAWDLYFDKPFCFEIEIKPDVVGGGEKFILNSTNSSSQGGIDLSLGETSSGDINFRILNSAGTVIGKARSVASTVSVANYTIIRVTGAGSGAAPKIYTATSPGGTFTEVSYSTQTAFASGNTSGITAVFNIGKFASGSNFYDGKIGYLKINNGSSTFSFTGFKNIAAYTNIQNGGTAVYGKLMIGENGTNANFAKFYQSKQNSALVDSYPLVFSYNLTFVSSGRYMHTDIQTERMSTLDNSNVENYEFSFS
jgi:hypothetical protein